MLRQISRAAAVALTAAALTSAPAHAAQGQAGADARGEFAASIAGHTTSVRDVRGENAASIPAASASAARDLRTPDAQLPVSAPSQPVVVEVNRRGGFDWTAAIIGMGAGLALAVLAGIGVSGGRRRPFRPSMS
jgi:hypothetical protein